MAAGVSDALCDVCGSEYAVTLSHELDESGWVGSGLRRAYLLNPGSAISLSSNRYTVVQGFELSGVLPAASLCNFAARLIALSRKGLNSSYRSIRLPFSYFLPRCFSNRENRSLRCVGVARS